MVAIAAILWALVAVLVTALLYGSLVEARRLRTDRLPLALPRLPERLEGLRIVHLGDTHCKPSPFYESLFRAMVEAVNAADADLVLISGDMAAGAENLDVAAHWLGQLRARHGVFAVAGNHDLNITMERWLLGLDQGVEVETVRARLAEAGVELLHNEARWLQLRGEPVLLLGVGDVSSGLDDLPATIEDALRSAPDAAAEPALTIVLTHSPDLLDRAGVEVADLVLAGHTHAGQMMLPGVGPVWSPVWHGRRRGAGLLAAGDVAAHVTRGVGTSWPVRLGCPPQVAVLELRRGTLEGLAVTPRLEHRSVRSQRRLAQADSGGGDA